VQTKDDLYSASKKLSSIGGYRVNISDQKQREIIDIYLFNKIPEEEKNHN